MSRRVPRVAVVGHTNVGKTSLLRTLLRDTQFGEVSIHPATTRYVEGAMLLVDGEPAMELYDTPGLEDSIGLLEYLDALLGTQRRDGIAVIRDFLETDAARTRFNQEAKALRQLLECDAALYVIDARDRVLGKHRDELAILGMIAKPVVPVLNFIANAEARTGEWREHLARAGMHAVAEFDTVVLDEAGERRLFEKMRTLLDAFADALDALIADRVKQRAQLVRSAADLIADVLIDVAALVETAPLKDEAAARQSMERLKETVRRREQECVDDLLELFRFRGDDYLAREMPIEDGAWGLDLFSPEALKAFGVRTTGAAAAGAMAGLAVDAMFHGLTLGAAAATGAALGALASAAQSHGRRLIDRARGFSELRVGDATLRHLATRQVLLVRALLTRGHAAQEKIAAPADQQKGKDRVKLPDALSRARLHPKWSRLTSAGAATDWSDERRDNDAAALADAVEKALKGEERTGGFFG